MSAPQPAFAAVGPLPVYDAINQVIAAAGGAAREASILALAMPLVHYTDAARAWITVYDLRRTLNERRHPELAGIPGERIFRNGAGRPAGETGADRYEVGRERFVVAELLDGRITADLLGDCPKYRYVRCLADGTRIADARRVDPLLIYWRHELVGPEPPPKKPKKKPAPANGVAAPSPIPGHWRTMNGKRVWISTHKAKRRGKRRGDSRRPAATPAPAPAELTPALPASPLTRAVRNLRADLEGVPGGTPGRRTCNPSWWASGRRWTRFWRTSAMMCPMAPRKRNRPPRSRIQNKAADLVHDDEVAALGWLGEGYRVPPRPFPWLSLPDAQKGIFEGAADKLIRASVPPLVARTLVWAEGKWEPWAERILQAAEVRVYPQRKHIQLIPPPRSPLVDARGRPLIPN